MSPNELEQVGRECKNCGRQYHHDRFACDCGKWDWKKLVRFPLNLPEELVDEIDEAVANSDRWDTREELVLSATVKITEVEDGE